MTLFGTLLVLRCPLRRVTDQTEDRVDTERVDIDLRGIAIGPEFESCQPGRPAIIVEVDANFRNGLGKFQPGVFASEHCKRRVVEHC